MIKASLFFSLLISFNVYAENAQGFDGCGDYLLKGMVVENSDKDKISSFVYKVNIGTKSEVIFDFKDSEDLLIVTGYLDIPSEIKVSINKEMDGTLGEIEHLEKISFRKSNPLEPSNDSGIFFKKAKPCK